MSSNLFPPPPLTFAATRAGALQHLQSFIPAVGRYGRDRNHLVLGHTNVSRLSPAIRHRLILESECTAAPLQRYAPSTIEKFTQEVYWRRYWKQWLSLRPQVWSDYLSELETLQADTAFHDRIARCEAAESKVAIMNHFARELVETGYLHNHARMWFAGWWIHIERLPWQLGADFFFRHLLDGDPASNTLSWRWVAGLQTPGKTYLPRRSNLEKYLPAELLSEHSDGLEQLANPTAVIPESVSRPPITHPSLPANPNISTDRIGLWIHEEDLLPEQSPLESLQPHAALITGDRHTWNHSRFPENKVTWLQLALKDAASRFESTFGIEPEYDDQQPFPESIRDWAVLHRLKQVVTLRPQIGPLHDQLPELQAALATEDTELVLLDRKEDLELRPLATGGFFGFWKRTQRKASTIAG